MPVGHQRRTDFSIARQESQCGSRNPGLMQDLDRLRSDQRRLFGRFGDDRIPGCQGGGNLPNKNGQREIPRADTDKDTTPMQRQAVTFASRSR